MSAYYMPILANTADISLILLMKKKNGLLFIVAVQSLSCVWLFATNGLQHARLPCPSLSPSLLKLMSSQWCYLTISFSATLFSFCLQSFLASGAFPMSWLFTSGGQSIGASASTSIFPMNIQGWFPLRLLVWSPCNPRDSQASSPAPQFKSINSLVLSLLLVQLSDL